MKPSGRFITILLLALAVAPVRAEVLVLVHGYMGSAASWENSGVNAALEANGWQRAGVLAAAQLFPGPGYRGDGNKAYAVELPSLAPMMVQADYLQGMLQQIHALHPDDDIIVAAHSAGGVVARIVLVRGGAPDVRALIAIATPHLGTGRAIEALDATDDGGPVGWFKDMFGGGLYHSVKRSRGALLDLTPEYPGNLLFWLNRQPQPDIDYVSIVRSGPVGMGDEVVPVFSQDMNNVQALSGRSRTLAVASGHELNPLDGAALVQVLSGML